MDAAIMGFFGVLAGMSMEAGGRLLQLCRRLDLIEFPEKERRRKG